MVIVTNDVPFEYHLIDKGQEFGEVIAAIEQFALKNLSGSIEAATAAESHSDQRARV